MALYVEAVECVYLSWPKWFILCLCMLLVFPPIKWPVFYSFDRFSLEDSVRYCYTKPQANLSPKNVTPSLYPLWTAPGCDDDEAAAGARRNVGSAFSERRTREEYWCVDECRRFLWSHWRVRETSSRSRRRREEEEQRILWIDVREKGVRGSCAVIGGDH